jgi:glycosidase
MRGSRGGANTDANRRLTMVWGDGDRVQDPEGTTYTKQTDDSVQKQKGRSDSPYTYYKRLIMIRRAYPEIARGTLKALNFKDTKAGGYICSLEGRSVIVLHNPTNATQKLDLSAFSEIVLCESVGAGKASLDGASILLEGQTSAILRTE